MPVILDSEKAARLIEDIINNSEETLSIMLPVFRFSEALSGLLKNASARGVRITVLFSSDELNPYEKKSISEIPYIEICCSPEPGSKLYFNEKDMIITSLDLHNFHERKNGDVSVGLSRKSDSDLYEETMLLFKSFHESSIKLISGNSNITQESISTAAATAYHGFCIRCAMPITFNISKPYCRQCMNQLKDETDSNKTGNYCHSCARKTATTQNSPQCSECSQK